MSEDETETPGIAGGCALIVLAGGAVVILAIVSPGAAVLALWAVGTGALWRSVRKVQDGSPSPPPPEDESGTTNPQFSVVEDETNPHRSIVVWHKEGTTK